MEFLRDHRHEIQTHKDICAYTKYLLEEKLFKCEAHNELEALSTSTLSRALNGSLPGRSYKKVLAILDAVLDEFYGAAFDQQEGRYHKVKPPKHLPDFMNKEVFLGQNVRLSSRFPFSKIKSAFQNARKIRILQTLLPKWNSISRPLAEAVRHNGAEVQILLVEPYSLAARLRGRSLGHFPDLAINDLVISSVRMVIKTVKEHQLGEQVRLRFYTATPVISVYQSTSCAGSQETYMGIYWHKNTTVEGPYMAFDDAEAPLVKAIDAQFEQLWEEAEKDIPLDGPALNEHLAFLKERSEQKYFSNPASRIGPEIVFRGFYWKGNMRTFSIRVDTSNKNIRVENTISGIVYEGSYKELGANIHIIAHTEVRATPRMMNIMVYTGGTPLLSADTLKGLLVFVDQQSNLPCANAVLLKRTGPWEKSGAVVVTEEEEKLLKAKNLHPPRHFFEPTEVLLPAAPSPEATTQNYAQDFPKFLFYSSCYLAEKGALKEAFRRLMEAFDLGFEEGRLLEAEVKKGSLKPFRKYISISECKMKKIPPEYQS